MRDLLTRSGAWLIWCVRRPLAGPRPPVAVFCALLMTGACTSTGDAADQSGAPVASEVPAIVTFDDPDLPSEAPGTEFTTLHITRGGTYRGNFGGDDPDTAAVIVDTTEPVVIADSVLAGRGDLILSAISGVDLTVRDSRAYGLNPNRDGVAVGRFIKVERPSRLMVEHNEMYSTAGISVLEYRGDGTPDQSITVVGNHAVNIDGRTSNGSGAPGPEGFHGEEQVTAKQFVQLDKVHDVPGIEIAWNEVRNHPGESRVEDNISIYLSGGTADSPISIHDNLIDGAYPLDPTNDEFSGGGIMLGDGSDGPPPTHAVASDNVVLDTANYGVAISAGNNMTLADNRVLSSGTLPDDTPIASQNVGLYIWNINGAQEFFDNEAIGNVVGWEVPHEDTRNDFYSPENDLAPQNETFDDDVTEAVIEAERRQWHQRAASQGVVAGMRS